jgi:hypothetical protein
MGVLLKYAIDVVLIFFYEKADFRQGKNEELCYFLLMDQGGGVPIIN